MVVTIRSRLGLSNAVTPTCTGHALSASTAFVVVEFAGHGRLLENATKRVSDTVDVMACLVTALLNIQATVTTVVGPTIAVML